jgi:hypothetical protein
MAKAEVIITATDRTQTAIQSAQRGFQNLDNSAMLLNRTLKMVSGAAVGSFLVRTANQALTMADSINKAATRAGITTEAMSELAYAAKLADADINVVVKSINLMQRGLGEASMGAGEARKGLEMLGVPLKTLQALAPEEQFKFLADAIMALQDPTERITVGTKIFGRSFAELLPLFADGAAGMERAAEEARRLNLVIGQEQADAASEAKDTIDKLTGAWEGFSMMLVTKVAPALTSILNRLSGLAKFDPETIISDQIDKLRLAEAQMNTSFFNVKAADEIRKEIKLRQEQLALVRQLKSESTAPLTPDLRDSIITGTAAPKIKDVVLAATKSTISAVQQMYDQWNNNTKTTIEKQVTQFAAFEAQIDELLKANVISIEQANARISEELDGMLGGVEVTGKRVSESFKSDIGVMAEFASQAARNMQTAFANFLFDPFQDGLRGMLKGFVDTIRRMVAEFAASQLMSFFFKPFAEGSGLLATFAKFAIGGKAMGGSVMGSKPYIVGERGPELFVPGSNGSIVPNDRMGGVTVAPVYNIDARGATADLQKALPGILQENNRRIFDELDRRYGIGR